MAFYPESLKQKVILIYSKIILKKTFYWISILFITILFLKIYKEYEKISDLR